MKDSCDWCGVPLTPRPGRDFCNGHCRAEFHRQRNRIGALMLKAGKVQMTDLKEMSACDDDTAARLLKLDADADHKERYERIIELVVGLTGVPLTAIANRTRKPHISDARAMLLYLLIEAAGANRAQIAELLGRSKYEINDLYSTLRKKVKGRPAFGAQLRKLKERYHEKANNLDRSG